MQGSSRPDQEFLDAAAVCGHLLGEGSVAAFLAEHRRELFADEMFEDLFPTGRGRPSVPAERDRRGDDCPGLQLLSAVLEADSWW